jgi:hypothetical protein
MFGRMNLLTDGTQADGLVTKAWFSDPGFNNRLGVQVRFKFPDGSTGECTDRMLWVSDVGLLSEGSVVPVRYDPAKHSRVAIDVPALKERYAPVKAKLEAEREARLEAQLEHLGTEPGGESETFANTDAALAGLDDQIAASRSRSEALAEIAPAIMRAKASGDEAEVERLKAELKRRTEDNLG